MFVSLRGLAGNFRFPTAPVYRLPGPFGLIQGKQPQVGKFLSYLLNSTHGGLSLPRPKVSDLT